MVSLLCCSLLLNLVLNIHAGMRCFFLDTSIDDNRFCLPVPNVEPASHVFSISACLCVTCVTVEPPRQNDVQPPTPSSSSSQAPPAPSSSRYRERRSRRAHRSGGTRDDRYRSGQRQQSLRRHSLTLRLMLYLPF